MVGLAASISTQKLELSVEVTIRQCSAADSVSLALLGGATFPETFAGILEGSVIVAHCARHYSVEAYQAFFEIGTTAWLAELAPGDSPVAYALVAIPDLPGATPADLELKRIYALSRFHGAGVGARLMAASIQFARTEGAQRLLLGVFKGNAKAISFYSRQGFVDVAERQFQVGEKFYGDVVLGLSLSE
jgi:GNAT superfamily N-acetyltransferase